MSNNEVRIDVVPEIELHAKNDELVTSPPQEQAVREAATAGNGSTQAKDNNGKSSPPQELARMNLEMTASSKHGDLVQELRNDINKNLESELDPDQCCIYKVPEPICRVNKEAYIPRSISIGPLHHGKLELANMEKTKRRYMISFFQRTTIEKQDEILSFIKDNEKKIRSCYAETSVLPAREYVMMILYDAIFIVELFLSNIVTPSDSLKSLYFLASDLQLLENQLPYFVLEGIFVLAYVDSWEYKVKHFTDWKRNSLLQNWQTSGQAATFIRYLPCATKLHESGVKFKKIEGEDMLIRFEKQLHELQLPYLYIDDDTERVLRNVLALEQCHYPWNTHVCDFLKLMDFLIDSEKDVDLLAEHGIISCFARDNASIADMINKLCQYIVFGPSPYHEMCVELKEHCNSRWNKTMATLRRVYFSNLWRGTGTIAAVILLLLTVIQTICSIFEVV
ncbi:UPF0481 protein At3g47200-like [Pistacia vera]|uniref:UPF0481 protein At3g47200-like n=1 Tax=Pistacia vera TaxID=55513 RepID=UPI001262C57F|nr:UPF0481 protein At3g47200-like [Pistacia vera]